MTSMRKLEGGHDFLLIIFLYVSQHLSNKSVCFRGTFGVVKRVIHRRTGEVFAAKFLPLRSSTRTRAFQERDLLSRLAHPRVACLLDFFCTKRTLVLITETYPFNFFMIPALPVWTGEYIFCEFFNIVCSCCSHGLLDHLLLRGLVSEKEVNVDLLKINQVIANKLIFQKHHFFFRFGHLSSKF